MQSGKPLVLIVNAELDVRARIAERLHKAGMGTVLAGNGLEALSKYRKYKHFLDAIFTDVRCKGGHAIDGYQFVSMILRQGAFSPPPIFFTTHAPYPYKWRDLISLSGRKVIKDPLKNEHLLPHIIQNALVRSEEPVAIPA